MYSPLYVIGNRSGPIKRFIISLSRLMSNREVFDQLSNCKNLNHLQVLV